MDTWGRPSWRRLVKNRGLQSCLALATAAGFWLGTAPAAQGATDTLDQVQATANSSVNAASTQMLAQTFTAGLSGQIDRVSLFIGQNFATGGGVIQIQTVTGGTPSGTSLGSSAFSGFMPGAWRDYPFSPGAPVSAGTQYAIVVIPNSSSGNTSWSTSKTVTYAAGQLWTGTQATGAWTTVAMSGAFKTWVATGTVVNQPPVIAVASNLVSAAEGGVAANSGTYSDPDGDTVTLTASAGTVTKTGTSSGAWSWSQQAIDEAAGQLVTITANDGNGATATTSFTSTITGVAPTATISGIPATAPEGTGITLTGSATSPSAADNAAGFTYNWTVTKDGAPYASGSGATFTFTPNDEGVYVASMQATDDGALSGGASATVSGVNLNPTALIKSVTPSGNLVPNAPVTFAGYFSDPGAGDSHTITWTFGDGATYTTSFGPGASADFTVTHAYAKSGTYVAGLSVVDDDGGKSYADAKVVVGSVTDAIASIDAIVDSLPDLKRSQRNSLLRKLDTASRWLKRGRTDEACEQLDAFLERINSRHGTRWLSADDVATLTAATRAVELALGCNSNINIEE